MSNDKTGQQVWMMLGAIAGGVIGAAAALLCAPKKGTELIKGMASPFSRYFKKASLAKKSRAKTTKNQGKKTSSKHTTKKPHTPKKKASSPK